MDNDSSIEEIVSKYFINHRPNVQLDIDDNIDILSKVDAIDYALKIMKIFCKTKMDNSITTRSSNKTNIEDKLSPFFASRCPSKLIKNDDGKDDLIFANETPADDDNVTIQSNDVKSNETSVTGDHNDGEILECEFKPSQLDSRLERPIPVSPYFNLSPRVTPRSPHGVVEEEFRRNPWAMLIATIFLTKTTARQARPVMRVFFDAFPTPYHIITTDPSYMEQYFDRLGMRKRAHMIWKMSYQFVSANWRRASDLCGVGKYGEDAYRIFCLGHTDVEPTDRYLRLYLDWLKNETGYVEALQREHCEDYLEDVSLKYYSITLR